MTKKILSIDNGVHMSMCAATRVRSARHRVPFNYLFNFQMWEPGGTRVPTHVNNYFFLKNVLQINQNWTKFAENVRKTHTQIAFSFQNTN